MSSGPFLKEKGRIVLDLGDLLRYHTNPEHLRRMGPGSLFACIDLQGSHRSGDTAQFLPHTPYLISKVSLGVLCPSSWPVLLKLFTAKDRGRWSKGVDWPQHRLLLLEHLPQQLCGRLPKLWNLHETMSWHRPTSPLIFIGHSDLSATLHLGTLTLSDIFTFLLMTLNFNYFS